ncbi:MAG TPA: hypothetical protein PKC84_11335, partial [Paracoccaceae bacterium]|nr:hypothetical protein [Paracoccaceae bacterium]
IAAESSDYRETPFLWAGLAALAAPAILLVAGVQVSVPDAFAPWTAAQAGAAVERAVPTLAPASAKTVDIDRFLAVLGSLIGRDGNYSGVRDAKYPELNPDPTGPDKRLDPAYRGFVTR